MPVGECAAECVECVGDLGSFRAFVLAGDADLMGRTGSCTGLVCHAGTLAEGDGGTGSPTLPAFPFAALPTLPPPAADSPPHAEFQS